MTKPHPHPPPPFEDEFLRPGASANTSPRATVLRLGSRVASTRMEFHGPDDKLLSTGAGAYMVT